MISNLLNLRELGFIEYTMALNFYAVIVDVFGVKLYLHQPSKTFWQVHGSLYAGSLLWKGL